MNAPFRLAPPGRAQDTCLAPAALRVARIAWRHARLLHLHRLHRAWRDGDCRRQCGCFRPLRRSRPRRAHHPRRRLVVLAQPARNQPGGTGVHREPRAHLARRDAARDGACTGRTYRASRNQGGRFGLSTLRDGRDSTPPSRWQVRSPSATGCSVQRPTLPCWRGSTSNRATASWSAPLRSSCAPP